MDVPALLSIGTATPQPLAEQRVAADFAVTRCAEDDQQARWVRRVFEATTIRTRASVLLGRVEGPESPQLEFEAPATHGARGPTTAQRMVLFERDAPPLAARASGAALGSAGVSAAQITHLITVTCTGFVAPGLEHQLIRRLGLRNTVHRTQIGFMGCHAAINGLAAAAALARGDRANRVLLCCVELCSLHFQYGWDRQQIVANALFADGAAAAVVGGEPKAGAAGLIGFATQVIAGTEGHMGWAIGDHGFRMTLSPQVPQLIAQHLRPWMDRFLEEHGLCVERIGAWCIHAGGPRIVSAVAQKLGQDGQATRWSRQVLQEHGNMSSATVLFILDRMRLSQAPRPWVLLAFGPGLTMEAAILG